MGDAAQPCPAGDPAQAGKVIVDLAASAEPPQRLQLGEDCFTAVTRKLGQTARDQQWRDVSLSTAYRDDTARA